MIAKLIEKEDKDYYKWADKELIKCLGHDNR